MGQPFKILANQAIGNTPTAASMEYNLSESPRKPAWQPGILDLESLCETVVTCFSMTTSWWSVLWRRVDSKSSLWLAFCGPTRCSTVTWRFQPEKVTRPQRNSVFRTLISRKQSIWQRMKLPWSLHHSWWIHVTSQGLFLIPDVHKTSTVPITYPINLGWKLVVVTWHVFTSNRLPSIPPPGCV